MAVSKWLARDLTWEVLDSDLVTYLPIGGLTSTSHSPSKTDAPTTDFDSNGRAEHIPAERGDTFSLQGQDLEDSGDGSKDAGQERCEALSKLVGTAGIGAFRATSPGGNRIDFSASCSVTMPGGGNNDAASWQCDITVTGDITYS